MPMTIPFNEKDIVVRDRDGRTFVFQYDIIDIERETTVAILSPIGDKEPERTHNYRAIDLQKLLDGFSNLTAADNADPDRSHVKDQMTVWDFIDTQQFRALFAWTESVPTHRQTARCCLCASYRRPVNRNQDREKTGWCCFMRDTTLKDAHCTLFLKELYPHVI